MASESSVRPGLLRLPAELRLEIYDHLWPDMEEIDQNNFRTQSALIYTCHTIRSESQQIFYSRHILYGALSDQLPCQFTSYLQQIGPKNLALIPQIILTWTISQTSMDTLGDVVDGLRSVVVEGQLPTRNGEEQDPIKLRNRAVAQYTWQNLCHEICTRNLSAVQPALKAVLATGVSIHRLETRRPSGTLENDMMRHVDQDVCVVATGIRFRCQEALREIRMGMVKQIGG